ncbi:uncharacterized protein BP01DRAFT_393862 [Aspergillus saccharolyticus JOP 1030-1]|uniref:Uncharacterized protein n=1 Tax=Aspergillus saccharolyticus JOP 1030-1 TaxID=1450539 RepID=A0A318Z6B3_9EURO|nr:hypothetical protein BP01DRAFT_393862 [Aspergillus saccharolyticus JOP 1030-1]PYH42831.1 hypothetical protein BP01DRAFT_393862 [Aspergillus saccharolyticus JOP 1030-1]
MYRYEEGGGGDWFNWVLNTTTQSPPYRLSSTITAYYSGNADLRANMINCTSTEMVPWLVDPSPWAPNDNVTYVSPSPALSVSLEFDGETANYTIFILRFAGVLDAYHSDILANDTATPTWLRTVGVNNNSPNIGYTGTAGGTKAV